MGKILSRCPTFFFAAKLSYDDSVNEGRTLGSRLWKLFNSPHDLPAGKRLALLESEAIDTELRKEVLDLLEVSLSRTVEQSVSPAPAGGPEYLVGYQFDRFMIVGFIGQGGFGRIYAAHDRDLRESWHTKSLGWSDARASRAAD